MKQDIIKLTETREDLYSWLSAALYKPENDLLTKEFVDTLKDIVKNLAFHGIEQDISSLQEIVEKKEITLQDLKIDYAKLFLGPRALLAPPYESYYRDNKRVMGDSTLRVKKEYEESKMELSEDVKDLPDHIAVELNYLSYLCSYEKKAREDGMERETKALLEKEKRFLGDHLLVWIDEFTSLVEENAEQPYYQNIARILNALVKADFEIVKDLT